MTAIHLAIGVLIVAGVISWSFLLGLLEARVSARSEQRFGPNRSGWFGAWHLLGDVLKSLKKKQVSPQEQSWGTFFYFAVLLLLPLALAVVLLFPGHPEASTFGSVIFVVLLVFLKIVWEAALQFLEEDRATQIATRGRFALGLIGVTVLMITALVVGLRLEKGSLAEVEALQTQVPFFFAFSSPFCFGAALLSLASIYFLVPLPPICELKARSFSGVSQVLYRQQNLVWLLSLSAFWVHLFFGSSWAPLGPLGTLLFFCKTSFVAILLLWSQRVLPAMRPSDALALGLRILVPGSVLMLLGEAAFVAVLHR